MNSDLPPRVPHPDPEVETLVASFAPRAQEIFDRVFRRNQTYATVAAEMDMPHHEVKVVVAGIIWEARMKLHPSVTGKTATEKSGWQS